MSHNAALQVRIVTPSYNQAAFLGATIDSVLSQDHPAIAYVIADGGSTDGSVELLQRYEGRLQWWSQKDAGQADAIIQGLKPGDEPVLAWLNSDDTYAPGAVREACEYLARHPEVDVVYGDATFIDAGGKPICRCAHVEPYNVKRLRRYSDFIAQPAAFFRRSAFERVGGLDASLHYAMDYDLWLKMAAAGSRFAYVPRVWAHYRWFGQNKSAVGGWDRLGEVKRLVERHHLEGVPAFFRLEEAFLHVQQARKSFRHNWRAGGMELWKGMSAVTSLRCAAALLQPLTWQVIGTGQVLRRAGQIT